MSAADPPLDPERGGAVIGVTPPLLELFLVPRNPLRRNPHSPPTPDTGGDEDDAALGDGAARGGLLHRPPQTIAERRGGGWLGQPIQSEGPPRRGEVDHPLVVTARPRSRRSPPPPACGSPPPRSGGRGLTRREGAGDGCSDARAGFARSRAPTVGCLPDDVLTSIVVDYQMEGHRGFRMMS